MLITVQKACSFFKKRTNIRYMLTIKLLSGVDKGFFRPKMNKPAQSKISVYKLVPRIKVLNFCPECSKLISCFGISLHIKPKASDLSVLMYSN